MAKFWGNLFAVLLLIALVESAVVQCADNSTLAGSGAKPCAESEGASPEPQAEPSGNATSSTTSTTAKPKVTTHKPTTKSSPTRKTTTTAKPSTTTTVTTTAPASNTSNETHAEPEPIKVLGRDGKSLDLNGSDYNHGAHPEPEPEAEPNAAKNGTKSAVDETIAKKNSTTSQNMKPETSAKLTAAGNGTTNATPAPGTNMMTGTGASGILLPSSTLLLLLLFPLLSITNFGG